MLAVLLSSLLGAAPEWKGVAPGVEYARLTLVEHATVGDGALHVVRIDPALAQLDFGVSSRDGVEQPAAAWAATRGYSVVINAGMFNLEDRRRHEGRFVAGDHVNQPAWRPEYQSVLVFGPKVNGVPAAAVLDRDAPGFDAAVAKYSHVAQNLRLIKGPGVGVWKRNGRRWSEAALAADAQGRLLFLFSRTPLEMADYTARLLALPLNITHAMHVEGGPEASLELQTSTVNLSLCGSYETGFQENDDNSVQWRLPNVVGVRVAK